jgi:hypothetical protein
VLRLHDFAGNPDPHEPSVPMHLSLDTAL